jgi:hypothetical protein
MDSCTVEFPYPYPTRTYPAWPFTSPCEPSYAIPAATWPKPVGVLEALQESIDALRKEVADLRNEVARLNN